MTRANRAPVAFSLIVLNHNSGSLLTHCLESALSHELPRDAEIIVVDNASTDQSLEHALARWSTQITVIRNPVNGGFAWGNNKAIRESHGQILCLLNPDTVVREGALVKLTSFMHEHPEVGFAGPKVLNPDGTFQRSAKRAIPRPHDAVCRAVAIDRLFPNSRHFARYNLTYLNPDTTERVDASTGCCIVARRSMLDEIGLLDEGFFIYCEDVDWFLRAKRAGWQTWYVADAVIEHHHAYSESFRRYRAVIDFHRSMLRFHHKHYASEYPTIFNVAVYAGVLTRMLVMMGYKSAKGWRPDVSVS